MSETALTTPVTKAVIATLIPTTIRQATSTSLRANSASPVSRIRKSHTKLLRQSPTAKRADKSRSISMLADRLGYFGGTIVGQSDPDLTSARIVADALEGIREKGGFEMGAQNRLQLPDYRPLE